MTEALLSKARREFHAALLESVLRTDASGIPTNADRYSKPSIGIAKGILRRLGESDPSSRLSGQVAGSRFEDVCRGYLQQTFPMLDGLRPGHWTVDKGVGSRSGIARYDQYAHLSAVEAATKQDPELAAAVGIDYLIKPDVVVLRTPEEDDSINADGQVVDGQRARLTPLRRINNDLPILHASVSCKWTLRSDRAQNARSEALNLVRNRKGRLPHVVVVTGEPTPGRIASIALGTGDVDCVYHFALAELQDTLRELAYADAEELLDIMVTGKRLRDIADLPLDLAV